MNTIAPSTKCKDDYAYFLEEFCLIGLEPVLSIFIALLFTFEVLTAVFLFKSSVKKKKKII